MDDLDNSQDPDNNFLEAYSNPDCWTRVSDSGVVCFSWHEVLSEKWRPTAVSRRH